MTHPCGMGKKIEVDVDDLDALVDRKLAERLARIDAPVGEAQAAADAAAGAVKKIFGLSSDNNTQEQRVASVLGRPIPDRSPRKLVAIPCRHPVRGTTFTALVDYDKPGFPEGKTVQLADYRYPENLEARAIKAGFDGTHRSVFTNGAVDVRGGRLGLDVHFLQWRYETFDLADRGDFVGETALVLPKIGEPTPLDGGASARTVADIGPHVAQTG